MATRVPVSKSTGIPQVEDGVWLGRVVRVEEKYLEEDQFGNHDKIVLAFELAEFEDEEGEPVVLDKMVNAVISPKSSLFNILTALGVPVDLDAEDVDADQAMGKEAHVTVAHPKGADDWPRITTVTAIPRRRNQRGNAPRSPQEARQPSQSGDPVVQWWNGILAQGFKRDEVINLSLRMFEQEPHELTADELKALERELKEPTS